MEERESEEEGFLRNGVRRVWDADVAIVVAALNADGGVCYVNEKMNVSGFRIYSMRRVWWGQIGASEVSPGTQAEIRVLRQTRMSRAGHAGGKIGHG